MDKKGFYHLDMMTLAVITGTLSLVGLPWVCGATVQSLNHVRACSGASWTEKREVPMVAGEIVEEDDEGAPVGGVVKSCTVLRDAETSGNGGELSSTQPLILQGKRVMQVVEERKYVDVMDPGDRLHHPRHDSQQPAATTAPSYIPIPVISGIFLYLGLKIMKGNQFFERLSDILPEESKYNSPACLPAH